MDEEAQRQDAFQRSLQELLPVSPEQIKTFRAKVDERDEALSDSPPEAIRTRTLSLGLSPGFTPPEVALTPNLVTALVFLDSSGSPWPVTSSVLGSGDLYRADVLKNDNDNRVVISPLTTHGNSNLIVTLQGHEIPLVIRLVTRSGIDPLRKVDGLIIFQVQGRGPKAGPELTKSPVASPLDPLLYDVLDGIPPQGSKTLAAKPGVPDSSFMAVGETLYVRTRHSLLWPGHRARVTGPGGWVVFEAPFASPILMGLDDEIVRVALDAPDGTQAGSGRPTGQGDSKGGAK
jgi:intracellular multiplication protein IcmK